MAVYTDVAPDELARLLADYDLGPPEQFEPIAEGIENSNFLLVTGRGRFILTLYEKRVRSGDLPFFLGLLDHLAARGLACAQPVRTRAGLKWVMFKDRPAAILTCLEGASLRHPDAGHCAEAGAALARLHALGADFPLRRANTLSLAGWHALARPLLDRADAVEPGLGTLIRTRLAALDAAWPHNLPSGVIHADLFPDNVLFVGSRISGLIDFYFACNDAFAYDLAVMLNAWCFAPDGAFDRARGRALLAAYGAGRPLTDAEIASLPVLAQGAALRFLLTRLADWLDHDAAGSVRQKDPREFARHLRFHADVRSAAEYGA
jgi:homoserine kinase type II